MAGAFEVATRTAIEELLLMHAQTSKFGYILTQEGAQNLVDGIYDLLLTSRSLKSAGDKFLSGDRTRSPSQGAPTLNRVHKTPLRG